MVMKEVLILGIGNVLFNDAGVGAHIIQMLKMLGVPAGVELLDAGVGANLTPDVLCGYKLLVVIDAAKGHLPAGTVRRITPHYNADCVALMSMQKDELNEIFNLLKMQETIPHIEILAVSIGNNPAQVAELSPEVRQVIPQVMQLIYEILDDACNERVYR